MKYLSALSARSQFIKAQFREYDSRVHSYMIVWVFMKWKTE